LNDKGKALIICSLMLLSMFALPAIVFVQGQGAPYFKITLIVPGPNPSRKAWAEVVEKSLDDAGIDASRVELDWATVYSRALTPNASTVGLTYDEGGFDALFVGYAMGIDPDTFPLYDSSQFPPNGQNYNLWNNSENDRLGSLIKETTDEATRLGYVKQWEELAYDEQPSATLLYTQEVVAFDPTALQAEPFKVYHYPVWPGVEKWTLNPSTTQTEIVLAQTGPAPEEGLNPWLTTSYYDLTVWGAVFDGLTDRNDTVGKVMLPALATDWSVASDQKTWTVHLRQGVTWHDGVKFNATDVKFSYESAMSDDLASPVGAFVKEILGGPDNIKIIDEYTVEFDLPKPYAYFVSSIMARTGYGMMIPWHVLKDIPLSEWKTHAFNTASGSYAVSTPGVGTGTYTAYGPIGTGPYWYAAYDPTTFTNIMTKNDNYWNKAALENAGMFGIKDYYVQNIEDSDPAISGLKSGDVDVLDSQYHLETKMSSIEKPWGDTVSYDAFGVQELGFNMKHPVFGTGVDTPLGKQDPSRAAEAARYVRQAISHLVDRQSIIATILNGYGTLGVTTPITRVTAGFDTTLEPYSYDVDLAKSLLAAAGYDTGVPPPSKGLLEQYGLYIAVAVVVVVVVALGALYYLRRKRTPT
jgi:peptide/nickel transport system substrate-binding protein